MKFSLDENIEYNKNLDNIICRASKLTCEDVYPIVCVSYLRGSEASTVKILEQLAELGHRCYLFIYDSDKHNYINTIENSKVNVQLCSGFKGIVPKRNYVNYKMKQLGFSRIFVLDDDIKKLYLLKASENSEKLYRLDKVYLEYSSIFKIWQTYMELYINKYALCSICHNSEAVFLHHYNLHEPYRFGSVAISIDLDSIDEFKYRSGYGWDDVDFFMQLCLNNKLTYRLPFLAYNSGIMLPNTSVANVGDKKWTKLSMQAYREYGILMNYIHKHEQIKCKPNSIKLQQYINSEIKFEIKDLNILKIIEKEDLDSFEAIFTGKFNCRRRLF